LARADDLAVFAVLGAGAAAALDLPAELGAARRLNHGIAFVDPRTTALGCRVLAPVQDAQALAADLGLGTETPDDYADLRIRLGVPDGACDLDVEKSVLLESNFDALNGIDWNKGCYVGQEVTARTKYRGLVKRTLTPVALSSETAQPGDEIECAGQSVGELRSVRGSIALASLRLDALSPDRSEPLQTVAGVRITPLTAPTKA